MAVLVRAQLRRDTASHWSANNPILLEGEPGIELDTQQIKIGDGKRAWSALPYLGSSGQGGTVTGMLGVKDGLGNANGATAPIIASSLSAINAGSQSFFLYNSTPAPGAQANVVPEMTAGSAYGAGALNYSAVAATAVGITGGGGAWYSLCNEPEDAFSDNVTPAQAAAAINSWVTAIRALDATAKFVGPNLTSWHNVANGSAYPYGPPQTWLENLISIYASSYGTALPFSRLTVHGYVTSDMQTAFMDQPANYLTMLNSYSAFAAANGYGSTIWMTEGAVMFPQDTSVPYTSTQSQLATQYMHGMLTNANVERAYWFLGGAPGVPGWNTGGLSARAPFDAANNWAVLDVGNALAAAVAS